MKDTFKKVKQYVKNRFSNNHFVHNDELEQTCDEFLSSHVAEPRECFDNTRPMTICTDIGIINRNMETGVTDKNIKYNKTTYMGFYTYEKKGKSHHRFFIVSKTMDENKNVYYDMTERDRNMGWIENVNSSIITKDSTAPQKQVVYEVFNKEFNKTLNRIKCNYLPQYCD